VIKVPRLELTESIIPAAIGTGAREPTDLLLRAKVTEPIARCYIQRFGYAV